MDSDMGNLHFKNNIKETDIGPLRNLVPRDSLLCVLTKEAETRDPGNEVVMTHNKQAKTDSEIKIFFLNDCLISNHEHFWPLR